jgi:hypothetical protein
MPVVAPQPYEPVTDPFALLDRKLTDEEEDTARRHQTPSSSPANIGHVIRVADHVNRKVAEVRGVVTTTSNEVLRLGQVLKNVAPDRLKETDERLDEVEKICTKMNLWMKVFGVVGSAISLGGVAGMLAISDRLWNRAESEGEAKTRLRQVEQEQLQLRADFRDDRSRHYSPAPDHGSWLQPPPQKDVKP